MTTTNEPGRTESFSVDTPELWPNDVPPEQDEEWYPRIGDPKGARRAEIRIVLCWMVTLFASMGFAACYVTGANTQIEGGLLALALGGLATGLVIWARNLLPGHNIIDVRHTPETRVREDDAAAVVNSFSRGSEAMLRRPFLLRVLGLVGGVFGLAALFPLASLGERPLRHLYHTDWYKGARLVNLDGQPVNVNSMAADSTTAVAPRWMPGSILTVFPEGFVGSATSQTVLIYIGDQPLEVRPGRQGWVQQGYVAFSKICTHAGCPVALYDVMTHQLICPCHQSTFDVLKACKPVFGPAPRSLPQLALYVDNQGYLRARSDYTSVGGAPVGPGFWGRSFKR